MEAAVVDKIVDLAAPTLETIDGLQYSSKPLHRIIPPVLSGIAINTLQGLVDILKTGFEGADLEQHLVHVFDEKTVRVIGRVSNEHRQRESLLEAKVLAGDRSFKFNEFITQEEAMIGLQSCFRAIGDRDLVLKTISSLTSNDSLQIEDDGVSQTATAKAGIALIKDVAIKPRVTLAPFRTFREVEQPSSEFVLRIRKGSDGLPKIGLFEADGGAWKMNAIHNVRDWLKAELAGWTVIA